MAGQSGSPFHIFQKEDIYNIYMEVMTCKYLYSVNKELK